MLPYLLNEKETSVLLCVSVSQLQKSRSKSSNLKAQGNLPPFVKIGGLVRYVRTEVECFVEKLVRYGIKNDQQLINTNKKAKQSFSNDSQSHIDDITDDIPNTMTELCSFMN
jgi:predicted DNA-binding transcriptional regulator AlpA